MNGSWWLSLFILSNCHQPFQTWWREFISRLATIWVGHKKRKSWPSYTTILSLDLFPFFWSQTGRQLSATSNPRIGFEFCVGRQALIKRREKAKGEGVNVLFSFLHLTLQGMNFLTFIKNLLASSLPDRQFAKLLIGFHNEGWARGDQNDPSCCSPSSYRMMYSTFEGREQWRRIDWDGASRISASPRMSSSVWHRYWATESVRFRRCI